MMRVFLSVEEAFESLFNVFLLKIIEFKMKYKKQDKKI